jgi:AraC-like DNA-binding protein
MTETSGVMTETPDLVSAQAAPDPLDVVPQVLDLVRLTGAIFFHYDFASPWAYRSPPTLELEGALPPGSGSLVMFHIIDKGSCWVALDDGVRHPLSAGDVVVLPYGDAHSFGSDEPAVAVPIASILPSTPWVEFPYLRYGGDGEDTHMVCGYLRGDAVLFDPVLRALPPLIVVRPPDGPAAQWVRASVEYAVVATQASLASPSAGGSLLARLLFTEIVTQYLHDAGDDELTGWLAALRDPVVGPAIARMHARPDRAWTVADLAREVPTSKTVLVDRFHALLGRPPIRYLTEWRINLASGLLRTTDLGVAEVASRVGYTSEEAFSRAFKRSLGMAPAHWRLAA